jgi:hypothetical protein
MAGAQGTSLTGCLLASNRDAGRYFIRTTKGKKFITEVIPSASLSANISEHVGHQVRLTGQFSDSMTATTSGSTSGSTGDTTGDTTSTAQTSSLPQSDRPDAGKKAHEQDRNSGRQFTASNIEMISASGCPQSSTTPNRSKTKSKSKSKSSTDDTTVPKQ